MLARERFSDCSIELNPVQFVTAGYPSITNNLRITNTISEIDETTIDVTHAAARWRRWGHSPLYSRSVYGSFGLSKKSLNQLAKK